MAFVLDHCGMRLLTATSVDEALQVLHKESVDVLVSDIALPGGADGIELIRVIRARLSYAGGSAGIAVRGGAMRAVPVRFRGRGPVQL